MADDQRARRPAPGRSVRRRSRPRRSLQHDIGDDGAADCLILAVRRWRRCDDHAPGLQRPIECYDLYRTSLLNVEVLRIQGHCREPLQHCCGECGCGRLGATSGVSGWAVWNWGYGKEIWLGVVAAATLIAAVKPVLQINKKIELYGKLLVNTTRIILRQRRSWSGYRPNGPPRRACRPSIAQSRAGISTWPGTRRESSSPASSPK